MPCQAVRLKKKIPFETFATDGNKHNDTKMNVQTFKMRKNIFPKINK